MSFWDLPPFITDPFIIIFRAEVDFLQPTSKVSGEDDALNDMVRHQSYVDTET